MPDIGKHMCPECGVALHEITLIDRGGWPGFPRHYGSILYTIPEARQSSFFGRFPVEGELAAYMCADCGRVLLYGRSSLP